MGRHDFRPQRVLKLADQLLETKRITAKPPWYNTVQTVPPQQILIRTAQQKQLSYEDEEQLLRPGNRINPWKGNLQGRAPQTWGQLKTSHTETRGNTYLKGPKTRRAGMFKPKEVEYPEDDLRSDFFGDHPWELARPRVVLENSGDDAKEADWSRMDQSRNGKKLDGESVIQRQMYLMRNSGLSKAEAYDVARREFYALRHAEEIQRRVAKEEAHSYGAYFGKSWLEIGEELEDAEWERWKEQATVYLKERSVNRSQTVSYGSEPEDEMDSPASSLEDRDTQAGLDEVTNAEVPATQRGQDAFGGAPVIPGPS